MRPLAGVVICCLLSLQPAVSFLARPAHPRRHSSIVRASEPDLAQIRSLLDTLEEEVAREEAASKRSSEYSDQMKEKLMAELRAQGGDPLSKSSNPYPLVLTFFAALSIGFGAGFSIGSGEGLGAASVGQW
jgi:hypothetical protein